MKLIFSLILLVTGAASAAELNCQTLINLQPVAETKVATKGAELVVVDDGAEAKSYISEKTPGFFTLEAYLYNYDMRIYSEGRLDGDRLSLSTWTRDMIFEVVCKKAK